MKYFFVRLNLFLTEHQIIRTASPKNRRVNKKIFKKEKFKTTVKS